MEFEPWQYVGVFLAKLIGDTFGIMLGGGSFITQPGMIAANVPANLAVAHDLASASIGMAAFLWFYRGHKIQISPKEKRAVILWMAPVTIVGAVIGGHIMHALPVHLLRSIVMTVCCLGFFYSLYLVISNKKRPLEDVDNKSRGFIPYWRYILLISGSIIGVYDGIVGAGSGVLLLLLMMLVLRLDLKCAIPMANIIGGISLFTAGLTFLYLGLLRWDLLVVTIPSTILAAACAAYITKHVAEDTLRKVFTIALGALCCYLIYEQFFTHI